MSLVSFAPGRTWFGLEVVGERLVRLADIERLPFHDFWLATAMGSTCPVIDGETYVYLHDWEAFCRRFVETGSHRFAEGNHGA